jgi:heptosyltransferase-2
MVKPTVAEVRNRLREAVPRRQSIDPQAHHSLDYLHLAAVMGANPAPVPPRLVVTDAEVQQARSRFGVDPNQVWCGLNPGAEYGPAKRWPADRFAEVARRISESQRVRWILFGGARDVAVAADIASGVAGALNVAGQTSLRELMALLSVCRVVLTNDTGPMHVAAALGVPVVVPFGSTSVELTGPGLPGDSRHRFLQAQVPCAPCFLRECPVDFRCMTSITVEMAIAELTEVMRGPISRSAGGTNPAR